MGGAEKTDRSDRLGLFHSKIKSNTVKSAELQELSSASTNFTFLHLDKSSKCLEPGSAAALQNMHVAALLQHR